MDSRLRFPTAALLLTPPPNIFCHGSDHLPKEIGELSFRQVVLRIKLRKDAIAVALRDRVYVYHLADLSLRDKIYTADNPHGLLCLSTQVQNMVLACPSVSLGHVRVELYGLRKTQVCVLELIFFNYLSRAIFVRESHRFVYRVAEFV